MKHNVMPQEIRICPHCEHRDLGYFREKVGGNDLYYCPACYHLVEWNGQSARKISGEAYPNRDKRV